MPHHPFKSREARLGQRFFHEPVPHAHEVDYRRGHDMLEGGFHLPEIPGSSQTIGTRPLGQPPFHTSASGIFCGVCGGGLARSGCVQGLIVRLATDGEHATLSAGTLCSTGTRLAILDGELNLHDLILPLIHRRGPAGAEMPARTPRLALVPIDHKATGIKSLRGLGLPVIIGPRGPESIDAVIALTRHQQLGVQIARIHNVRSG